MSINLRWLKLASEIRILKKTTIIYLLKIWRLPVSRCKTDLNSFPRRKLDETTGMSSYYMDENHSAGSEIQRPQYEWHSWLGSEQFTLEIDVYVQLYALLVVLARNDDDDGRFMTNSFASCCCFPHFSLMFRSLCLWCRWAFVDALVLLLFSHHPAFYYIPQQWIMSQECNDNYNNHN